MERLKAYYDLSAFDSGEGLSVPISIRLPEDKDRVQALERKLAEYERRAEENRYQPPGSPLEGYKREVLERLLQNGRIFSSELMAEFGQNPGFDEVELDEAIRIIYDYATTGGQNNQAGTGLS
jgi:hypothetical protein